MMTILPRASFFLVTLSLMISACTSQSVERQSFSFAQTQNGRWRATNIDGVAEYIAAGVATCELGRAVIEISWNSESGDWIVLDRYSSDRKFFIRTIRFAQSDSVFKLSKDRIESTPELIVHGSDIEQYLYLVQQHGIWTSRHDFPFEVPECADIIFSHQMQV